MLEILRERFRQQHRTSDWPNVVPSFPDRLRGLPVLDDSKCQTGCEVCVDVCPTDAIQKSPSGLSLDMGRCLFCTECATACPGGAIQPTTDHRLAASARKDLVIHGKNTFQLADALDQTALRLFGRSLKLRQISAGGCNGCEADINVLTTLVFDLGRFGIKFVASPRHADGIIVTGPVTENMKLALQKCYDCVPTPKFVIAVGACAISGGPFINHVEANNGVDRFVKVDLYIPGCPPHPWTILDGLLRMLGRIEAQHDSDVAKTVKPSVLPASANQLV